MTRPLKSGELTVQDWGNATSHRVMAYMHQRNKPEYKNIIKTHDKLLELFLVNNLKYCLDVQLIKTTSKMKQFKSHIKKIVLPPTQKPKALLSYPKKNKLAQEKKFTIFG